MPIAPRAPPKAMRGKCERGHAFSPPGLRFHGVDRADVYYNICVRASRYGKCALNPPTSQPIPRRRPSPVPAQRHALPEHSRSPTQRRYTPAGCAMHTRCPHNQFPAQRHALPNTSAPPRSADARPQRHAASPSVPLRAQKNGTAQCMCDAECLGRPSLRSVIWVGEPRAVCRRCGALACRRGA